MNGGIIRTHFEWMNAQDFFFKKPITIMCIIRLLVARVIQNWSIMVLLAIYNIVHKLKEVLVPQSTKMIHCREVNNMEKKIVHQPYNKWIVTWPAKIIWRVGTQHLFTHKSLWSNSTCMIIQSFFTNYLAL